jgi:NAD(P)H-quinone oxidoreductase subunit 6
MNGSIVRPLIFYALSVIALGGAAWVAFSRNIVHSAFALLATFIGVAGLYAMLSADLVAVVQLMVYVGGILILILFAVMLTARIDEAKVSNPSLGLIPGLAILLVVAALMLIIAGGSFTRSAVLLPEAPTAAGIGNALLGPFVLPFEVISVLLFAALLGAVTLASGKMSKREGNSKGEAKR